MNKFQQVNFADVQQCLDYLPEHERQLANYLRHLIFECIPQVTERLNYNVPFYFKNNRIGYIWPGSIPWGGLMEGVALGFAHADLLHDEWNFLNRENKKTVGSHTFLSLRDVHQHEATIRTLLFEAAEIDELKKKS